MIHRDYLDEIKECIICKISKSLDSFCKDKNKKDGLSNRCRDCAKLYIKKYRQREDVQLRRKEYSKQYNNRTDVKLRKKIIYLENRKNIDFIESNKRRSSIYSKTEEYKIKRRKRTKLRKANDPLFKLRVNISNLISKSLKTKGLKKNTKTKKFLGCDFLDFSEFLGRKPSETCQLDHICPCSQAQNEEELIKLQHYTNFRWLEAHDNLEKRDKCTKEALEMCRILLNRDWIIK